MAKGAPRAAASAVAASGKTKKDPKLLISLAIPVALIGILAIMLFPLAHVCRVVGLGDRNLGVG